MVSKPKKLDQVHYMTLLICTNKKYENMPKMNLEVGGASQTQSINKGKLVDTRILAMILWNDIMSQYTATLALWIIE